MKKKLVVLANNETFTKNTLTAPLGSIAKRSTLRQKDKNILVYFSKPKLNNNPKL